jgi:lipoprotein-anchoring transpeptidase ErfK/SrfK
LPNGDGNGAATARPLPLARSLAAAAALLLSSLLVAGCGSSRANTGATRSGKAKPAPSFASEARRQASPHDNVVATATTRSVAVYRRAASGRPFLRLKNPTESGAPLVFLVRRRSPGWEQVYLPVRPNESTGWVRDRDVRLALDPYRVEILRRAHELRLWKDGRVLARYRAGVGRSVLPTPTGRYYVVELLKQPDPAGPYGPYAFGLSAYSNVLYSFGGGPGQIGIHGTDDPSSVGRSVSHGCIRLSNVAITRLARALPLGTPVTIAG